MVSNAHRAAAICLLGAALLSTYGNESDRDELSLLLDRLAANAALYRTRALRFTSSETIRWSGDGQAGRARFGYVYVFDEAEGFEEYRTRDRKTARKRVPKRVRPEAHGVQVYLNNAYLWCFTFRAERQERHSYSILGTETVAGIEAIKIRFIPIPPLIKQVNDWYGTAWVDPKTAQPLKVEVFSAPDWVKRKMLQNGRPLLDNFELRRITSYFGERLDGLAMPSRVELRDEKYVLANSGYRKTVSYEVDQVYSNYRSFGVSAKEKMGVLAE